MQQTPIKLLCLLNYTQYCNISSKSSLCSRGYTVKHESLQRCGGDHLWDVLLREADHGAPRDLARLQVTQGGRGLLRGHNVQGRRWHLKHAMIHSDLWTSLRNLGNIIGFPSVSTVQKAGSTEPPSPPPPWVWACLYWHHIDTIKTIFHNPKPS